MALLSCKVFIAKRTTQILRFISVPTNSTHHGGNARRRQGDYRSDLIGRERIQKVQNCLLTKGGRRAHNEKGYSILPASTYYV